MLDQCDKLPGKLDEATAIHYRLLGDLVLDGLGGDPRTDKKYIVADGWRRIYSPLMEHRELQMNNAIRPNGFVRLSWKDEIDDSPQFARAYLPPDYDAKKKYPMIISLHGYNSSNPEYIRWWGVTERHNGISDHDSVIVIEPHGRANTGYEGIGEFDVLTAIQLAKKTFSVDDDHVYLMGYSMGGGGTWYFGTRHPEFFAAIGPFYGGWDYHIDMKEEDIAPYRNIYFNFGIIACKVGSGKSFIALAIIIRNPLLNFNRMVSSHYNNSCFSLIVAALFAEYGSIVKVITSLIQEGLLLCHLSIPHTLRKQIT